MFGFVNIYKDELKIKEYNVFRAYYCGLCKALGSRYNQLVRLGLSYDMTFLAILADGLNDSPLCIKNSGCVKHLGKHSICFENKAINYCADVSIILTYHKLKDDLNDEHSLKAFFGKIPYIRAYKRACKRYPHIALKVKEHLEQLSQIEKSNCKYIDMAADPFASLTSYIFQCYDSSLNQLGYNIGRFIYIADAYNDLQYDKKHNTYNPYLCAYSNDYIETNEFRQKVMGSLNMTLTAISESYMQLKILKNKEILNNIIYLGLRNVFERLFTISEDSNDRSI